jgi:hypothetical protein
MIITNAKRHALGLKPNQVDRSRPSRLFEIGPRKGGKPGKAVFVKFPPAGTLAVPIRSQVQPTGGMHSLSASESGAIPLRDGDFAGNGGATENREAYPAPRRLCEIGIGAEGPDLGGFEYLAAMGYLKMTRVAGAGSASSSSLMTLTPPMSMC